MKKKSLAAENRRKFLLTFFEKEEGYDELELNNFWLIKQWDGNSKKWVVHIYPQDSYENYKSKNKHAAFLKKEIGLLDDLSWINNCG